MKASACKTAAHRGTTTMSRATNVSKPALPTSSTNYNKNATPKGAPPPSSSPPTPHNALMSACKRSSSVISPKPIPCNATVFHS